MIHFLRPDAPIPSQDWLRQEGLDAAYERSRKKVESVCLIDSEKILIERLMIKHRLCLKSTRVSWNWTSQRIRIRDQQLIWSFLLEINHFWHIVLFLDRKKNLQISWNATLIVDMLPLKHRRYHVMDLSVIMKTPWKAFDLYWQKMINFHLYVSLFYLHRLSVKCMWFWL